MSSLFSCLNLADRDLDLFPPHALLTHGRHPACLEPMRWAPMRSILVAFHLRQLGYNVEEPSPLHKLTR
jgi:hypothetical protein